MSEKSKLSSEFDDEDNKIFGYFLVATLFSFFISLVISVIMAFIYKGNAAAGSVVDGVYYLGHGSNPMGVEVNWFIFKLSEIVHGIFISSFILIVLFLVVIKLFGKEKDG